MKTITVDITQGQEFKDRGFKFKLDADTEMVLPAFEIEDGQQLAAAKADLLKRAADVGYEVSVLIQANVLGTNRICLGAV